MPPEICPNCGAEVPPKARACPECGADEQTGWSEAARTDGLDLPDENFDYDDFVKREFGGKSPVPRGIHWFWWVVALLVAAAFIAYLAAMKGRRSGEAASSTRWMGVLPNAVVGRARCAHRAAGVRKCLKCWDLRDLPQRAEDSASCLQAD